MFSLFVGEDVPGVPQNIKQSVDGADVVLTWESEPLGWNSHYVNVSKLTYDIWETPDGINLSEVAKGVTGTTYRIEGRAEQGKQQQNIYVVRAISSAGPGSRGYPTLSSSVNLWRFRSRRHLPIRKCRHAGSKTGLTVMTARLSLMPTMTVTVAR